MKSRKASRQGWFRRAILKAKRHPVYVGITALVAVVIAVGGFTGAIESITSFAEKQLVEPQYLSIDLRRSDSPNIFDADFVFANEGQRTLSNVQVTARINLAELDADWGNSTTRIILTKMCCRDFPLLHLQDIPPKQSSTARIPNPWEVITTTTPAGAHLKSSLANTKLSWRRSSTCLSISFEERTFFGRSTRSQEFGVLIDKDIGVDHWITRGTCEEYEKVLHESLKSLRDRDGAG